MTTVRKIAPRDQWLVNDSNQVSGLVIDGANVPITFRSSTIPLTVSHTAMASEDGNVLANTTGTGYTLTIPAGLPANWGCALLQVSTGTCTVAAGSGVTIVGATLATSAAGGLLSIIWTSADNYVVKAS
jgi:hypothetical protein